MEILRIAIQVALFPIAVSFTSFVALSLLPLNKAQIATSAERWGRNSLEHRNFVMETRSTNRWVRLLIYRYLLLATLQQMMLLILVSLVFAILETIRHAETNSTIIGGTMLTLVAVIGLLQSRQFRHLVPYPQQAINDAIRAADYVTLKSLLNIIPPNLPVVFYVIMPTSYRVMGDFKNAKRYIQIGLNQLRSRPSARRNISLQTVFVSYLGSIYALEGDHHKAIQCYEQVIQYFPAEPYTYKLYAESLLYLNGDLAKIETLLNNRIAKTKEQSDLSATHLLKAWMLAKQGDAEQAQAIIQRVLGEIDREHIPDTSEVLVLAGHVELALGNQEAARNYFQQALKIDPEGLPKITAQRGLAQLQAMEGE